MGSDMIVEAWNAAAAASLAERVAGIVEPVPGCARPVDDERSDVRRTWQHLVADGREDRFARRLAALGPTPASTPAQAPWSVDGLLGAVRPAGAEALTWDEPVAALLRMALATSSSSATGRSTSMSCPCSRNAVRKERKSAKGSQGIVQRHPYSGTALSWQISVYYD